MRLHQRAARTIVWLAAWAAIAALSPAAEGDKPSAGTPANAITAPAPARPLPGAATSQALPSELALPSDHELTDVLALVASDLAHGGGSSALAVQRTWLGNETLNTHFGPGWSDSNSVRLTLIADDSVLVWRGGIGWRLARRQSDAKDAQAFVTADGDRLARQPQGWTLTLRDRTTLAFDADGRLLRQSSPAGIRSYTYDDHNRLITIGDRPENSLRYVYEGNRVSRVEGPEGLVADYRYDAQGRLLAVSNARRITIGYEYDPTGRLLSARDQFGRRIPVPKRETVEKSPDAPTPATPVAQDGLLALPRPTFKFDAQGRMVEKRLDGWTSTYTYDASGQLVSETSPLGHTSLSYDLFGRIAGLALPDGRKTVIRYNRLDLPVEVTGPDGVRRTLAYDDHGRLTRSERSPSDWEAAEYDQAGRVSVLRRAPGLEKRYTYDARGRVTEVAYSTGRKARYNYDTSGNVASEWWTTGEHWQYSYDSSGRLVATVNEHGLRVACGYDPQGRLVSLEDDLHGKTLYPEPETLTRRVVERPELGRWTTQSSPQGLPLLIAEPGGRQTILAYNERGKPLSVIGPGGAAYRYEYDPADRPTAIIAPGGLRTVLSYDAAGRLASVTRGGVAWRKYQYDALGRLQAESSATGIVASYRWGDDGQLAAVTLPDGQYTYQREPSGTQLSVKGPSGQLDSFYHPDGRLARQVHNAAGLELRIPADAQGRPAGVELGDLKVQYGYNARGQLNVLWLPGGQVVQLQSDAAGRPAKLVLGPAAEVKISYDKLDRITGVESVSTAAKQPLFHEHYKLDVAGNVVELTPGDGRTQTLQYDGGDRLVRLTVGGAPQSFEYDARGSLWSTTAAGKTDRWTLDGLGRPASLGTLKYQWDAAGNLAATIGPQTRIENTFDAAGRLVRRRVGPVEWRYGYLPDGMRLWQEGAGGRTWYAYHDGELVGLKDPQGVTWLLVTLPGGDMPLAVCNSRGQTYFALCDRRGSLRRLIDANAAAVAGDDYGPFGERTAHQGTVPIAIFAGLLRDESGLYYAKARYYDPGLRRFISMDPELGTPLQPVTQEWYAYAGNNPYRFRDTSGAILAEVQHLIDQRKAAFKPPRFPMTEIRTGMSVMGDPEARHLLTGKQEKYLSNIAKRAEDAQKVLQNPASSQAAREAAERRLTRLANEMNGLAKEFKANKMDLMERGRPLEPPRPVSKTQAVETLKQGGQAAAEEGAEGAAKAARRTKVTPIAEKVAGEAAETAVREGAEKGAQKAAGEAAETAVRKGAEKAGEKAAQEAAEKGIREAAEKAAEEGTKRAAGEVAKEVLGHILIIVNVVGVAVDTVLVVQKGKEVHDLNQADSEEIDARHAGNATRDALEKLLRDKLAEPKLRDRIIPRDFTGKPDDIDSLVQKMHGNFVNGRRPLDGILTDAGKTVPAEAKQGLRAALAAARGLITQARVLELAAANAARDAATQDDLAKSKMAEATAAAMAGQPIYSQLAGLPAAAGAVRTQIAAVRGKLASRKAAPQAMQTAVQKAQSTSSTVCDYARRSLSASESEINSWKSQATNLVSQSEAAIQAAKSQGDEAAVSTDQLQQARDRLSALRDTMVVAPNPKTVSGALDAARTAVAAAERTRAPIAKHIADIQALRDKALAVLEPYRWDDEVPPIMAQARALGQGLTPPNPVLNPETALKAAQLAVEVFLTAATRTEEAMRTINVDALTGEADGVLSEARTATATPAANSAPGDAALSEARVCLSMIKVPEGKRLAVPALTGLTEDAARGRITAAGFKSAPSIVQANQSTPPGKEGQVADQAPSAGAQIKESDTITLYMYPKVEEVIVPSVRSLSFRDARDQLQKVGLTVASAPSSAKTPDKASEYTVASQSPAPGAKAKKKDTVTLTIYGPFQPTPPTVVQPPQPPPLTFAGRWTCNHNATWNLTQTGNTVAGTVTYPGGAGQASVGGNLTGKNSVTLGWRDKGDKGSINLTLTGPNTATGTWIYDDSKLPEQKRRKPDGEALKRIQ